MPWTFPAVPGYGGVVALPGVPQQPDPALRYRVVFSVTQAAREPDGKSPGLDHVARLLNLLALGGVSPAPGDGFCQVSRQMATRRQFSSQAAGREREVHCAMTAGSAKKLPRYQSLARALTEPAGFRFRLVAEKRFELVWKGGPGAGKRGFLVMEQRGVGEFARQH